jgi:hypothetical protein
LVRAASIRRGWNIISPSCDTDLVVTPAAKMMPITASARTKYERWVRARIPRGTRHSSTAA